MDQVASQVSSDLIGLLLVAQSSLGGEHFIFRFPQVYRKHGLSLETRSAMQGKFANLKSDEKKKSIKEPPSHPKAPPAINMFSNRYSAFNMPSVVITPVLCPTKTLCNAIFETVVDRTMFIGRPTLLDTKINENINRSNADVVNTEGNGDDGKSNDRITMFNLVLAISRDSSSATIKMCKEIAEKLALALLYEENRCNYVRNEISLILSLRDKWLAKQLSEDPVNKPDHQQLTYDIIQASSFGRTISDIFHGLKDDGLVHIRINSWVSLSLTLRDFDDHPEVPLRPYQTLLMLEDIDTFLASLPVGSSNTMRLIAKAVKPTKSFSVLQRETGVPLHQIYRVAAHLIYWKKAKVMEILTKLNIYILHPSLNQQDFYFPFLSAEFSGQFPDFKLAEVLEIFSIPRKLGDTLSRLDASKQKAFIDVVTWMLKRDLLMQLHTYVFLMLPDNVAPERRKFIKGVTYAKKADLFDTSTPPSISSSSSSSDNSFIDPFDAAPPPPIKGPLDNVCDDAMPSPPSDADKSKSTLPSSGATSTSHVASSSLLASSTSSDASSGAASSSALTPSNNLPSAVSTTSPPNSQNAKEALPYYYLSPEPLTDPEIEFLKQLNDSSASYKLFIRLCPYFRGRHHMEEIMWRENISRDDLYKIIQKYNRLLIPVNL